VFNLTKFRIKALLAFFLSLGAVPAAAGGPLAVAVSIAPQKYFVEQIAGDLVSVQVMIPAGASPASYEPRPSQMAALARCRLYFAIGVGFEKAWLDKFTAAARNLKVVHTDRGIPKVSLPRHFHPRQVRRNPEKSRGRRPEIPDPHIWLDPRLVEIQAGHMTAALADADPQNAAIFRQRYRVFRQKLRKLDSDLRQLLEPVRGAAFMVFHPSWGYFARAYGLIQVPLELEGKEPKPAQLRDMIRWAREKKIRAVFVQPQFNVRTASIVARAIGAKIVEADPLAYDWERNLRQQAQRFLEAMQ